MKLSFFFSRIFLGTFLVSAIACDKKVTNPCNGVIEQKKCPHAEAGIPVLEQTCSTTFQKLEKQDQALALEFSKNIKECVQKEKCEEIWNCITLQQVIFEKKAEK